MKKGGGGGGGGKPGYTDKTPGKEHQKIRILVDANVAEVVAIVLIVGVI